MVPRCSCATVTGRCRASTSGNQNELFHSEVMLDSKNRGCVVFKALPLHVRATATSIQTRAWASACTC